MEQQTTPGPALEGTTQLHPSLRTTHTAGPATHHRETPFYNPAMELNRTLSVLLLQAEVDRRTRELDVADPLCGGGARSLRIANEVEGDLVVHANDGNPDAGPLVQWGQRANHIPKERLHHTTKSAHAFLASRRFDVVDIDPFGSPVPFLDGGVASLRHDGILCLTATDTAALSGTYPRVCRRRYGAEPMHLAPWRAEVGLRILAGTIVRAAGRFDRGAEVMLSLSRGHWMRVVARIRDGRGRAKRADQQVGYAWLDKETGTGQVVDRPHDLPREAPWAGPLWTGHLHDHACVHRLREAADPPSTQRLLDQLVQEAGAPPFWLHGPALQRIWGPIPQREPFMQELREAGHHASGSHMDPQGIRTDAPLELVRDLWQARRKQ